MKTFLIYTVVFMNPLLCFAKLNIVATTQDLAVVTETIAGPEARVQFIAPGTQDPHFLEAKPSYILKLSGADLVIANGLSLESGWLPSIIRGARNPKIETSGKGYLELGGQLNPIQIPSEKVTHAHGDVHSEGNPHFTLDPIRTGDAALLIAKRLGELDPEKKSAFDQRATIFQKNLKDKANQWRERLIKTGVKKVITYHQTLDYFLDRFGIESVARLEPKPGIPPTAQHTMDIIRLIKTQKIPLILIESHFDDKIANRIKQDAGTIRIEKVPVSVGVEGITSTEGLIEKIVSVIESKR